MRETTLRNELQLQKGLIQVYSEMPLNYDRLIVGVRGSLRTLQRLSKDVDDGVYDECGELLEDLA